MTRIEWISNIQYLHLGAGYPPKIGVEYKNVYAFPITTMLID
jgi:hypothetical protein